MVIALFIFLRRSVPFLGFEKMAPFSTLPIDGTLGVACPMSDSITRMAAHIQLHARSD